MSQFDEPTAHPGNAASQEAAYFVRLLAANIDNANLTDAAFRSFVRNSLAVVAPGVVASPPAGYPTSSSQFEDRDIQR